MKVCLTVVQFSLNPNWLVAAGEDSQERLSQRNAESKVQEAIYCHPSSIPAKFVCFINYFFAPSVPHLISNHFFFISITVLVYQGRYNVKVTMTPSHPSFQLKKSRLTILHNRSLKKCSYPLTHHHLCCSSRRFLLQLSFPKLTVL